MPGLHAAQMPGFGAGKAADAFAGQCKAHARVAVASHRKTRVVAYLRAWPAHHA